MKKSILLFITILISYGSCKEIDKLTHFYIENNSNITIESTLPIEIPFDIWTPNIPTNSETSFENNNTRTDLIEEIVLSEMIMNIISPDSQSFDFLKSIEIFISTDSTDEKKIAWNNDIPKTGLLSISLETTDDDLKDYIKKNGYIMRSRTVTRQLISVSTDIEIFSKFFVDATLLGI